MTPLRPRLSLRPLLPLAALVLPAALSLGAPLSQQQAVDFFRDVPSRNLQGLATRSDGRLVAGPVLRELPGTVGAELLWRLAPGPDGRWLLGTGPDGRILEITLEADASGFTSREIGRVDDAQVYALRQLPDGSILAGSSPRGGLHLLRDGQVVASANLPADSVLDLLLLDDGTALAATGNPGRIYRIDLATFARAGIHPERVRDPVALEGLGLTLFGQIRDRNARRLALAPDGRVLLGSAPAGNVYSFPRDGGTPIVLLDHQGAEVSDLLVGPEGDIFASVIFASSGGEARVLRPTLATNQPPPTEPPPAPEELPPMERFGGRSAVVRLPAGDGFPETIAARGGSAFYRLALRGDTLLIAGGDEGELLGWDRASRRALTFGGSASAQLSDLVPLDRDHFLVLRNNAPGLAVLDFNGSAPRRAETRRLDLRQPATIGALRLNRLREVAPSDLRVSVRVNRSADELEGWSGWHDADWEHGGWFAEDLRGRYVRLRLELPADTPDSVQIDGGTLAFLPQNRRPQLQSFRIAPPNLALIPRTEQAASPNINLGQLVGPPGRDGGGEERRSGAPTPILGSPVVPQAGAQIVYWGVEDADGDNLAATFSIRREGAEEWTDLAVDTRQPFVQFDRSHLADGIYFTRLVVSEQAPRPTEQRLTVTFETDDLVIDRTPPQITAAALRRRTERIVVEVSVADERSLPAGVELRFNHGLTRLVEQPVDGILDRPVESFVADFSAAELAGATAVEIVVTDSAGNSAARRLDL